MTGNYTATVTASKMSRQLHIWWLIPRIGGFGRAEGQFLHARCSRRVRFLMHRPYCTSDRRKFGLRKTGRLLAHSASCVFPLRLYIQRPVSLALSVLSEGNHFLLLLLLPLFSSVRTAFKGYRLPTSCKKHTGTGSSSPKRARCSGVVRSSSLPLQWRFHYLSLYIYI